MGKCLSCCKEVEISNHVDHPENLEVDGYTETHNLDEGQPRFDEPTLVLSPSVEHHSVTSLGRTVSSNGNEKRMFYSRIPPILGSSGDNKRSNHGREYSESKIITLFDQYKDTHEDAILSEGIERLCQDLEVKPEDFKVLLLAWKCNAETMCRFSRHEFITGCRAMKVSSIKGIQGKFSDMLREAEDADSFKDLYRFAFKFGLDVEMGQRILPTDMAISLWKLVFSQNEPPILKRWLQFLDKHPNVRGIPRDTWNMFLNFLEAVGDDLSSYDDSEAWPSLFDDFVEYENDQTNQNIYPKDVKGDDDLNSR